MTPSWLDSDAWDAFIEVRRKKGHHAPLTDTAKKRILLKLARAHADGYDSTEILWQTVESGWSSVYVNERSPRRSAAPESTNEYLQRVAGQVAQERALRAPIPDAVRAQLQSLRAIGK